MKRICLKVLARGAILALLVSCAAQPTKSSAEVSRQAHRCGQVDDTQLIAPKGTAACAAKALGGKGNKASADATGDGSNARAVAGSLDLYDHGKATSYLPSDGNTSLAQATNGAGAQARSGVNDRGTKGVGGNTAVARADQPHAYADASAANGNRNNATSLAQGCTGKPGNACAFSAAGNGNDNTANAASDGKDSTAQAGALDGDHNAAFVTGTTGGHAAASAQGGNSNTANSTATGSNAFATTQATGGGSFALSRADGGDSTANAVARNAGTARALADDGATATASATGSGFTAYAYASGAGTSATATHDADTDTGSCTGPGIAFAITNGAFQCVQGF